MRALIRAGSSVNDLCVEFSKNPGHENLPLGALGSTWGGALGSPLGELNLFVYP